MAVYNLKVINFVLRTGYGIRITKLHGKGITSLWIRVYAVFRDYVQFIDAKALTRNYAVTLSHTFWLNCRLTKPEFLLHRTTELDEVTFSNWEPQ